MNTQIARILCGWSCYGAKMVFVLVYVSCHNHCCVLLVCVAVLRLVVLYGLGPMLSAVVQAQLKGPSAVIRPTWIPNDCAG